MILCTKVVHKVPGVSDFCSGGVTDAMLTYLYWDVLCKTE